MKIFTSIVLILLFSSCSNNSNYEIIESEYGSLYRLNKNTGEVKIIEGRLIKDMYELNTEENVLIDKDPMYWPEFVISHLDSLAFNLRTRWREGYMYYIFDVSPYTEGLQEARTRGRFILNLSDRYGFQLLEIPINISDMIGMVDDKGERRGLSIDGRISCTLDTYMEINNWTSSWTF